jgi:hypothetical protein
VSLEQCRWPSKDKAELFEWMEFEADANELFEKMRQYNTEQIH